MKHCFLMGKNTVEAKQWLDKRYGDSAPGKSTIIRYQKIVCLQFWTNLCGCVSCFRSVCHVCSHSTRNNNASRIQNAVWSCSSEVKKISCVGMWQRIKHQTINSDYYMALLDRLSAEIKKKRPHMQKKKVLVHQDNAPCHESLKTMDKLNKLRGGKVFKRFFCIFLNFF